MAHTSTSGVEIDHIVKTFGDVTAVDDVSFVAESGQLTTLLGPSGCGKTTTLRCIAGLERPDSGLIKIDGEVVSDPQNGVFVPPDKRNIGFVFQTFDVWPHMTVYENVAYPLENRDYSKSEIEAKVEETLEMTDILELKDQPARNLSGGQQARVNICRAIVYEPQVLLFDEPLTGLDRNLRKEMRYEIRRIQTELEITTVYVTHSQPEAMIMSDKICLFNRNGKIEQMGDAEEIYTDPVSEFAFRFFGGSRTMPGEVTNPGGVRTDIGELRADGERFATGDRVLVGFRPEDIAVRSLDDADWADNVFEGEVVDISFVGEHYEILLDVEDTLVRSRTRDAPANIERRQTVAVHIDPADVQVFEE